MQVEREMQLDAGREREMQLDAGRERDATGCR